MICLFCQTITLILAEECFRQGWQEALHGETMPISELWVGIDALFKETQSLPQVKTLSDAEIAAEVGL